MDKPHTDDAEPMPPNEPDSIRPAELAVALVSLIGIEQVLSIQLLETIKQEQEAISTSDLDAIDKFSVKKHQLAIELETAGQKRDRLLTSSGFTAGPGGIRDLLDAHPSPALSETWQSLFDAISRCKEENRLVGMIINRQLSAANQAIQVIKTGSPVSEHLYVSSGKVANNTRAGTRVKI